jgi:hypothetical protein
MAEPCKLCGKDVMHKRDIYRMGTAWRPHDYPLCLPCFLENPGYTKTFTFDLTQLEEVNNAVTALEKLLMVMRKLVGGR